MIIKTEAIVLRIRPFSRTSHVVTWLSPEHGRVTTVVKGASRPTSAFLGQYDLFATCELLFYRRDHDGVHAIRECTPLQTRDALRPDWRRITTACYCADLAARVASPAQESPELYRLLSLTLDELCSAPPSPDLLLRYELAVLRQAGLMPNLESCAQCNTAAQPWLRFGLASGRAHCVHAPAGDSPAREPAVTVHRDVLARLAWLAGDAPAPPPDAGQADHLFLGSRRLLGVFMQLHLDVSPVPRRLAFELLETVPATWGWRQGE